MKPSPESEEDLHATSSEEELHATLSKRCRFGEQPKHRTPSKCIAVSLADESAKKCLQSPTTLKLNLGLKI